MTNKLVVIINSLKIPKIKNILLYEMKFLVPNYSCLQNSWLVGYRPQIPVLSVLNWICWTPPPDEQNSWVRHCLQDCVVLCTVCVWMCTVLLPPGVNPIAVNNYIKTKRWRHYFPSKLRKHWTRDRVVPSSSYPSIFWLVGSFPFATVASHSFHCCITVSGCVSGDLL